MVALVKVVQFMSFVTIGTGDEIRPGSFVTGSVTQITYGKISMHQSSAKLKRNGEWELLHTGAYRSLIHRSN